MATIKSIVCSLDTRPCKDQPSLISVYLGLFQTITTSPVHQIQRIYHSRMRNQFGYFAILCLS